MPPKVLEAGNGGVTETVFFDALRELDEIDKQMNMLKAKKRVAWKRAEDSGLVKKDLETVMKDRLIPISERIKSHNNRTLYQRFLKVPGAEDIPILDEKKADGLGLSEEEWQARWENDGFIAGRTGRNRDTCPHEDPNSLGARFWMAGYDRGQAENAAGIKATKKKIKEEDEAKAKAAAEEPPPPEAKIKPKPEPEVQQAGARRKGGVTYWHNAELKKVYEITSADADPVGATNITKPEYTKLKAEYEAAEKAEWEAAEAKVKEGEPSKLDDFGDDEPPAPGTKLN